MGIVGVAGCVSLGVGVTGQVVPRVIGERGCIAQGIGFADEVPLGIVGIGVVESTRGMMAMIVQVAVVLIVR